MRQHYEISATLYGKKNPPHWCDFVLAESTPRWAKATMLRASVVNYETHPAWRWMVGRWIRKVVEA